MAGTQWVEEPDRLKAVLSPIRRQLLGLLREPASANQLAEVLQMPRQRVGYHLRELEKAGLLDLVETRQRRGFTERILRATADAYIVDPAVLGTQPVEPRRTTDRHASEHLIDTATHLVRDVSRMQQKAEQAGTRLLTFTAQTEICFGAPDDVYRFSDDVARALAELAAKYHSEKGRRYIVVAAGHPTPDPATRDPETPEAT